MKSPASLILLLGPSGAGKSTLAAALSQSSNRLHIELDQWQADGVDIAGLRREWDDFYQGQRPEALSRELTRRVAEGDYQGAIVSLPSLVVLPLSLIEHAQRCGISTVILYGSGAECLAAFLRRLSTCERNLDANYWIACNAGAYMTHSRPEYAPYRIEVFCNGKHRALEELQSEILRPVAG